MSETAKKRRKKRNFDPLSVLSKAERKEAVRSAAKELVEDRMRMRYQILVLEEMEDEKRSRNRFIRLNRRHKKRTRELGWVI